MKIKDKKIKTAKKKAKENATLVADENVPAAACSKSFIVPGNPLAPHNRGNWGRHVEELAVSGGSHSVINVIGSHSRLNRSTPLALLSGVDKHSTPLRVETPAAKLLTPIQRKPSFLPEIDKKYLPKCKKGPEERGKKINPAELELPEGAQHIQTTNSAVSFTLFYKSASRRLDPLPRHHSDVMDKRDNRRNERNLERRERSPTKYHRSGGTTMDSIRQCVEGNRRQREKKNLAVTRAKLEQLETNSRLATPEMTSRIMEVRARQDQLREENYLKSMRQFMTDFNKNK